MQYSRTFTTTELSISGSIDLSEAGLFTDGDPASSHAPGTRDITLAQASNQPPQAYKSFESIKKTQNFELELNWEIRF